MGATQWGQNMLWASGHMYIGLGLPHVHDHPAHLLGTYTRLQHECATGCDGVLGAGDLRDGSCSQGAGYSPNRVYKGVLAALHRLEGFLGTTAPSWELDPNDRTSTTLHQVDGILACYVSNKIALIDCVFSTQSLLLLSFVVLDYTLFYSSSQCSAFDKTAETLLWVEVVHQVVEGWVTA